MEADFDKNQLEPLVGKMSRGQKLLFMLSCCERLFPNYSFFQKKHNWGEPETLRMILDYLWESFKGGCDIDTVKELTEQCNRIVPDSEDFDTIDVSSAMDAGCSVLSVLSFLLSESIERILDVAVLSYDTVDMYVQELEKMSPNDPGLERKIFEHRFVQQELKRQREDVEFLLNKDMTDEQKYEFVKNKYYKVKESNIGIF